MQSTIHPDGAFLLPEGKVGSPYEYTFEADGGVGQQRWRIIEGQLPQGLALDSSGKLHGTLPSTQPGTYKFTVQVSDSTQSPVAQSFVLVVKGAPLAIKKPNLLTIKPPKADEELLSTKSVSSIADEKITINGPSVSQDPGPSRLVRVNAIDDNGKTSQRSDEKSSGSAGILQNSGGVENTSTSAVAGSTGKRPNAGNNATIAVQGAEPAVTDITQAENLRTIVGFEQAGASSASSTQKFFFDLYLSHRLPTHNADPPTSVLGGRTRIWGDARITSVPQQITSGIGTFAADFVNQVKNVKVNEVAQAAIFTTGIDVRILPSMGDSVSGKPVYAFSFVAGGGAITPINPRDSIELFKVSPEGIKAFPTVDFTGKDVIAFVPADRDRFFRTYFAGLRMKTYFNNGDRPPAMLDITFGQNEAVTGGRLRGGVFRLEGFYPLALPTIAGKSSFLYLFGSANMKLSRTNITNPLILAPAPSTTTFPASNVVFITVPQLNRDYYRLGVGIDLSKLFPSGN